MQCCCLSWSGGKFYSYRLTLHPDTSGRALSSTQHTTSTRHVVKDRVKTRIQISNKKLRPAVTEHGRQVKPAPTRCNFWSSCMPPGSLLVSLPHSENLHPTIATVLLEVAMWMMKTDPLIQVCSQQAIIILHSPLSKSRASGISGSPSLKSSSDCTIPQTAKAPVICLQNFLHTNASSSWPTCQEQEGWSHAILNYTMERLSISARTEGVYLLRKRCIITVGMVIIVIRVIILAPKAPKHGANLDTHLLDTRCRLPQRDSQSTCGVKPGTGLLQSGCMCQRSEFGGFVLRVPGDYQHRVPLRKRLLPFAELLARTTAASIPTRGIQHLFARISVYASRV